MKLFQNYIFSIVLSDVLFKLRDLDLCKTIWKKFSRDKECTNISESWCLTDLVCLCREEILSLLRLNFHFESRFFSFSLIFYTVIFDQCFKNGCSDLFCIFSIVVLSNIINNERGKPKFCMGFIFVCYPIDLNLRESHFLPKYCEKWPIFDNFTELSNHRSTWNGPNKLLY